MSRFRHQLKTLTSPASSILIRKRHTWLSGNIVRSPFEDVQIPQMTLPEFVFKDLGTWANKTAVVCGVTDRSYSYEQLYKQSQSFGANLRKKFRIKDEDIVAVMLPNIPEFPAVVIGSLAAGATVTTVNPIYTAHEVLRQLSMTDSKVIITIPEVLPVIRSAFELLKKEIPIIAISTEPVPEKTGSYFELANDENVDKSILKEVKRKTDDVALLPYSSGTTGLPKGVQLMHSNIVANSVQQNTELRQYDFTNETHQDSVLGVLPFFHSYGLSIVMFHKLSVGIKVVTLPKFQPTTFMDAILKHRISLFYVAPPMALFLGSHPDVGRQHLDNVKSITCGAAPLPAADIHRLYDKAGRDLNFTQGYGLTETSPLATLGPPGFKNYKSVGYALPNSQLRVIDANFNSLGPNEIGELALKGPNIMKGYKNNPEANKEAFLEDGWFRSGDQAKIDEDGVVTIADRLKELIKVKGFQVPPAELEAVLRDHPEVSDAAVFGVPHPMNGEAPIAYVVLKKKIDTQDIKAFVDERVAKYKRLENIVVIDSIPKNASGKIMRKDLKAMYCKS